jgi:hypothetical protein
MKKLAYLVLLLIGCYVTTWVARGGDAKGSGVKGGGAKDKAPNYSRWNGIWFLSKCRYETAVAVAVTMTGVNTNKALTGGPLLMATFITGSSNLNTGPEQQRKQDIVEAEVSRANIDEGAGMGHGHEDGVCTCGIDQPKSRLPFLRAYVTGSHLKGKIWFCTTNKVLADAKKLTAVFECDFEGDFDPDTDTITGSARSEFYRSPDGKPENYARVPAEDPMITLVLTLKKGKGVDPHPKLPDTNPDPTPTPNTNPLAAIKKIQGDLGVLLEQSSRKIGHKSGQ